MMKMRHLLALAAAAMLSTHVNAASFGDGGASLDGALDAIATDGNINTNVLTDEVTDGADAFWQVGGSGGSVSTVVVEIAAFAADNKFGIYDANDTSNKVELFAGAATTGSQALLSIYADGSVYINFADTGIDFAGNKFGYYLDSSANVGGGMFYSDTASNSDGMDHMYAYQGTGEQVQIAPYAAGPWESNEYILAFEDLDASVTDADYSDFVVLVESVTPVPAPATLALMGLGLLGMGLTARRRKA